MMSRSLLVLPLIGWAALQTQIPPPVANTERIASHNTALSLLSSAERELARFVDTSSVKSRGEVYLLLTRKAESVWSVRLVKSRVELLGGAGRSRKVAVSGWYNYGVISEAKVFFAVVAKEPAPTP